MRIKRLIWSITFAVALYGAISGIVVYAQQGVSERLARVEQQLKNADKDLDAADATHHMLEARIGSLQVTQATLVESLKAVVAASQANAAKINLILLGVYTGLLGTLGFIGKWIFMRSTEGKRAK